MPGAPLKPSSLFGAVEILEMANEFCISKGKSPYYDIRIVSGGARRSNPDTRLNIRLAIQHYNTSKPDIIIIPGLYEDDGYSTDKDKELARWVRDQYGSGCELASLCTGAFFLAGTGLLNGKECSTHWKAEEEFRKMFPNVKLCTDKIITDSKGIYTAGGGTSSLNLMLYLVEKYNGRQTALYCAKLLQIDIERDSQSPFILFEGQKNHEDEAIKKVQLFIERNVEERITVEFLADKFSISKRSFIRRFKKATHNVPVEYIQKVKMEAAKRGLEKRTRNVNEVMYSVGYSDIKAFRNIFKKVTGLTPMEYKLKFSKS